MECQVDPSERVRAEGISCKKLIKKCRAQCKREIETNENTKHLPKKEKRKLLKECRKACKEIGKCQCTDDRKCRRLYKSNRRKVEECCDKYKVKRKYRRKPWLRKRFPVEKRPDCCDAGGTKRAKICTHPDQCQDRYIRFCGPVFAVCGDKSVCEVTEIWTKLIDVKDIARVFSTSCNSPCCDMYSTVKRELSCVFQRYLRDKDIFRVMEWCEEILTVPDEGCC